MPVNPKIKRLFVLMLENRSYDNILGWSDLRGWTPDGKATQADGLTGKPPFANATADGVTHTIGQGAPFCLNFDPGHEFSDVLIQLCGSNPAGVTGNCLSDGINLDQSCTYPAMAANTLNLGYAASLQAHGFDIASAMSCFAPTQLPVIDFLARQFAVCDRWFSSMPGPTWPNRFFALAGTAWDIDYSPADLQTVSSEFFDGKFGTGSDSLLTRLEPNEWLVAYGDTPQSWTLKGVDQNGRTDRFVHQQDFFNTMQIGALEDTVKFVFIEPHYDPIGNFRNGESMHPTGDVRNGEALIKTVYEAIKNSNYWMESTLLIVFDEHGGFFDHVVPDAVAIGAPALTPSTTPGTKHNFNFDRYGPRVPAIVVSPYVRQATIDHTFYDHLSIAKTLADIARPGAGVPLLATKRFDAATSFSNLFSLSQPRASSDIPDCPDPVPLPGRASSSSQGATARALSGLAWPPDPDAGP